MAGDFDPVEFLNQENISTRSLLGLKKDKLIELAQECDLENIKNSTKKVLVNGIAEYLDLEQREREEREKEERQRGEERGQSVS